MRENTFPSVLVGLIAVCMVGAGVYMGSGYKRNPPAAPIQKAAPAPQPVTAPPVKPKPLPLPLQIDEFHKRWEEARKSFKINDLALPNGAPYVKTWEDGDEFQLNLTPSLNLHGLIEKKTQRLTQLYLVAENSGQDPNVKREETEELQILVRMLCPTYNDKDVNNLVGALYFAKEKYVIAEGIRFDIRRSEQTEEIVIHANGSANL